jgi:hypothetical protein
VLEYSRENVDVRLIVEEMRIHYTVANVYATDTS